jgi:N-acetylglucosamine PTS system EIICBA or EIICB component
MFGLPAACLAMLHEAPKERRAMVAGLLLSMALTSFLTGVTEPIEFTFMFLAPVLYGIHAVLTGLSLAICSLLNIKLGFTFSAGFIDYVLNYGLSTHGWEAIPLGVVYAVVYYVLFRFFIRRFNLPTPGREASNGDTALASSMSGAAVPANAEGTSRAARYIDALGGAANLKVVDACTTRLRLSVADPAKVSEPALKVIGARGVLKRGGESVQVIIGPEADIIADEIRNEIKRGGGAAAQASAQPVASVQPAAAVVADEGEAGPLDPDPSRWLAALGGSANVVSLDVVAATRLRVVVRDAAAVDRQKLDALDMVWVSADTMHIVVGRAAQRYAQLLAPQPA